MITLYPYLVLPLRPLVMYGLYPCPILPLYHTFMMTLGVSRANQEEILKPLLESGEVATDQLNTAHGLGTSVFLYTSPALDLLVGATPMDNGLT